jgi:hypothetical protein
MDSSTASILPAVINTWPGVSVGPETVWTVAPVSKRVSANEEKTPEMQKINVRTTSPTARLKIPKAVPVFVTSPACHALFPLTLTLSLREREQQAASSGQMDLRLATSAL